MENQSEINAAAERLASPVKLTTLVSSTRSGINPATNAGFDVATGTVREADRSKTGLHLESEITAR
jgi:hypothetical protein